MGPEASEFSPYAAAVFSADESSLFFSLGGDKSTEVDAMMIDTLLLYQLRDRSVARYSKLDSLTDQQHTCNDKLRGS